MHRRKRFRGAVPKRPASAANNTLDLLGDVFLGSDFVHDAVEELHGGQPLAALVAKHDVLMSVAGAVVQEGGHDDGDEVESMPTSSSSDAEAADPEDLEDLPASAPATASSISSMLGRDSKHAINVQPQPLASDDVSGGWVVSKNAASGTLRFVPASDHFRGLRGQRDASLRHAKTRNHFLSQCEILFGPDAITANRSDECLHEALSVVEGACKGRLWGISKVSCDEHQVADAGRFRHRRGIPLAAVPEMSDAVSVPDLFSQYIVLREWLRALKTSPAGHEFYIPVGITLQRKSCDNSGVGSGPWLP